MPTAQDLVDHYAAHVQRAQSLFQRFEQVLTQIREDEREISAQINTARLELARAYLPTLERAAMEHAETLTGFRGFSRRDPLKAMDHERKVLEKTVATVSQHELYVRREFLVGPFGEHTRALTEAKSLLEPWQQECAKYEDLKDFLELIELKYDTTDYAVAWHESRYWRLWASGDAICTALDMDDFGDDVLPAYTKAAGERAKWVGEVERVESKIDEVHGLVHQHDRAVARLPELPTLYLDGSHQVLAEFLNNADLGLLAEWQHDHSGDNRAILMGLRKLAGLQAKLRFLQEMRQSGVEPFLQDMQARTRKYARKQTKFTRSKYYGRNLPISYMDASFSEKEAKYRQRAEKIEKLMRRIREYDRYHRFNLTNDPNLWWVEITRKPPSSLTPQLRSWYDQHPGLAPDYDEEFNEPVAEATAARELDDLGYLS